MNLRIKTNVAKVKSLLNIKKAGQCCGHVRRRDSEEDIRHVIEMKIAVKRKEI